MVEIPETAYSVLLFKNNEIFDKKIFDLNYDALKYISDLRNTEYAFIGWLEIKKGSKLIWIIDHNLINNQTDAELLQKINTFLFGFDDEWVDEWT